MRHTGYSLLFAVGLVFGLVTNSAADGGGGGGFWEKMSGPGKWAYGYAYYSICLKGDSCEEGKVPTFTGARLWLNLGGSFATTGDENRAGELVSPDLRAISFEPSVDFRVVNWHENAPILVGVGAGVHRFWGEDVGFTRASVALRVSAILFRHEGAYVGVRYTFGAFLEGFSAADFGDPLGTYSTNGADRAQTFSLFVHLGH
jgi:hypothetical protein